MGSDRAVPARSERSWPGGSGSVEASTWRAAASSRGIASAPWKRRRSCSAAPRSRSASPYACWLNRSSASGTSVCRPVDDITSQRAASMSLYRASFSRSCTDPPSPEQSSGGRQSASTRQVAQAVFVSGRALTVLLPHKPFLRGGLDPGRAGRGHCWKGAPVRSSKSTRSSTRSSGSSWTWIARETDSGALGIRHRLADASSA